MANLALRRTPAVAALLKSLDAALRLQIDYPAVTLDVAQYNIDMACLAPGGEFIVHRPVYFPSGSL